MAPRSAWVRRAVGYPARAELSRSEAYVAAVSLSSARVGLHARRAGLPRERPAQARSLDGGDFTYAPGQRMPPVSR